MYCVYVLKSRINNEIYVGSTNNIERRLAEHNSGNEISTKRYMPWELLYYETYQREELARLREKRLKSYGNALRELKKRIGLSEGDLPSTTFFSKKSGAGFTLIELVVVVSVTALLASYLILYGPAARRRTNLQVEKVTLAQFILKAKSLAISTMSEEDPPPCGYGVRVVKYNVIPQEIEIFRLRRVGLRCSFTWPLQPSNSIESHFMPPEVVLVRNSDSLDGVFFRPPDPQTFLYFLTPSNSGNEGKFYLATVDNSPFTGSITVSDVGQVTIN